ncbi:hypothetical protein BU14_0427s0017 [Porphyra umbilicalis]|uniref:Thioredoxin domain-containing protein n=1 Tax=Porphyra umbilicalis TaxID=2786 RepID=A0A1X6NVB9_PORUM|nr:hypothetical protein BU14_0427s0017 [Porphyra umbilicalis]|eukprot:OSX72527.1 hypothetical protein BU14_0427s0017 [Porphyra umbilicalis]
MGVIIVNTEAEFEAAIAGPTLVVVDFFATWCGPCRAIAPYLETLSKQADVVAAGVRFLKVDVDRLDKLAAKCSVSAMPTFHYYMGGKKVAEVVGARQDKIKQSLDAHMPASKMAVATAAAKPAVSGAAK